MRLLLVTQDFPPETGGIQSYMAGVASRMPARCRDFAVLAPGGARERRFDASLPYEVARIPVHSSWLALGLWPSLGRLVRRRGFTHVLYAQWFPAANRIGLPDGVRTGAFVHGRELKNHPLGKLGLSLAGPTLRRMDALFPNSRHTASLLPSRIAKERIHVVHPGVDLDRFVPPSPEAVRALRERLGLGDAPVVSCLTRLVERKGVDTLLRSFALLRERMPEARLVIGGKGSDEPRLRALHAELGLGDAALFAGRLGDGELCALLSLGVFALLSRETGRDVEGFGMVLTEAQACGACVVAARSGGMPEAVGEGAGIVVPPDDPAAAAAVFEELLRDPVRRQAMGEAGQGFASGFDWDTRSESILAALA
jgi:phosphatidylinositol alpha-1,6-mannosyltransferase